MPSIYERIGGASAVAAAVDDLYARIMRDRVLAPYFERIDLTRQKRQLAEQAIAQTASSRISSPRSPASAWRRRTSTPSP